MVSSITEVSPIKPTMPGQSSELGELLFSFVLRWSIVDMCLVRIAEAFISLPFACASKWLG